MTHTVLDTGYHIRRCFRWWGRGRVIFIETTERIEEEANIRLDGAAECLLI